jgi:hypothetical protein
VWEDGGAGPECVSSGFEKDGVVRCRTTRLILPVKVRGAMRRILEEIRHIAWYIQPLFLEREVNSSKHTRNIALPPSSHPCCQHSVLRSILR